MAGMAPTDKDDGTFFRTVTYNAPIEKEFGFNLSLLSGLPGVKT